MKKPLQSFDAKKDMPAIKTVTETEKQVVNSENQLPTTTGKLHPTIDEKSTASEINMLKNYSQFFIELS